MISSQGSILTLLENGVSFSGEQVDVFQQGAMDRLRELLGPELLSGAVGVRGIGRTAHWLRSGIVLVGNDTDDTLSSLYVCFDRRDSSPFPDVVSEVAVFSGIVEFLGVKFSAGEPESSLARLPHVEGFSGMFGCQSGRLSLGLDFRKRLDRFGKRTGSRMLVQLVAEWGGSVEALQG